MDQIKKERIYKVVGFEKNYLNFIVAVYRNSQFYILFNEAVFHDHNEGEENFKKILKQGQLLNNLVKKASKELNMPIREASYNLPIEKLKIVPYEYIYKFDQPTLFTKETLQKVNQEFLKSYQKNKNYQNFLFKINEYVLLEQSEILVKPPLQRVISSIKIKGLLYQVEWKQLYKYEEIFQSAHIKPINPILLPYAIYINILFSEKNEKSIIFMWKENKIQLFVFEKKIFTKFFEIDNGLKKLWNKIVNKLNIDKKDVKQYVYNILNLSINKDRKEEWKLIQDWQGEEMKKISEQIKKYVVNYLEKVMQEIDFILEEKNSLNSKKTTLFVFGDIIKISGIEKYLQNNEKKWKIKMKMNNFIGCKNENDLYLLGNAYYRYLQNKMVLDDNNK